jgi:hypothetical protein
MRYAQQAITVDTVSTGIAGAQQTPAVPRPTRYPVPKP